MSFRVFGAVSQILNDITGNIDAKKACTGAMKLHKKYLKKVPTSLICLLMTYDERERFFAAMPRLLSLVYDVFVGQNWETERWRKFANVLALTRSTPLFACGICC